MAHGIRLIIEAYIRKGLRTLVISMGILFHLEPCAFSLRPIQ